MGGGDGDRRGRWIVGEVEVRLWMLVMGQRARCHTKGGAHGVSALDTPKLEDCCLFVFGKGFGVDTQRLVGDTSSSQHNERAFAFVSLLVSLGTSPAVYAFCTFTKNRSQ